MAQSLIVVDRGELAAEIERTVQNAIQSAKGPDPRAMTTRHVQDAFSISESTVKNLRRRGLPHFFIGDSPRFDRDTVLAWLREHGADQ